MGSLTFSVLILSAFIYGGSCGDYCGLTESEWCTYGCCGSGSFTYCCYENTDYAAISHSLSTGIIVAIVIGCIIFVATIVGIIICCVCCCKAAASSSGTVYRAQPAAHMTVISPGTTNAGFVQPNYPMATQYGYSTQPAYPTQNGDSTQQAYPPQQNGDPNQTAYPPPQYPNSNQSDYPTAKY